MLHRKVSLIQAPTPLHRLENASRELGVELWVKRDDLTGLAGGGNKGRKLEYLIADIRDSGADAVVTRGAHQSNFVRQCAGACAMFGIEFHAATMHWPHPPGKPVRPADWSEPQSPSGNALLDDWLGARIHLFPDGDWETLDAHAESIASKLESEGKRVYRMPSGGSSPVGALGFVAAVQEILDQGGAFENVVFASGSGGTQSGIAYGLRRARLNCRAIGVCTDDEPELVDDFARIAEGLDHLLQGDEKMGPEDFELDLRFHGGGYQAASAEADEAIRFLARNEGIFLDPVYTGKAFAGVMAMARGGELPGRTLFWHTGGFPTLFAHGREPTPIG